MPLWTSLTLEKPLPGTPVDQWSSDVRLYPDTTQTCGSYASLPLNATMYPLFPPGMYSWKPYFITGYQELSLLLQTHDKLDKPARCNTRSSSLISLNNFSPFPAYSLNSSLARLPYLVSNAVPVSPTLAERWGQLIDQLIPDWVQAWGPLNVVLGPVFDNNADSYPDNFTGFGWVTTHGISVAINSWC